MQYQFFYILWFFLTEKFSVYQLLLLTMEIIDNWTVCQLSIDINKFPITILALFARLQSTVNIQFSVSYDCNIQLAELQKNYTSARTDFCSGSAVEILQKCKKFKNSEDLDKFCYLKWLNSNSSHPSIFLRGGFFF